MSMRRLPIVNVFAYSLVYKLTTSLATRPNQVTPSSICLLRNKKAKSSTSTARGLSKKRKQHLS